MSEMKIIEKLNEKNKEISNVLVDSTNDLVDVALTLESMDLPQANVLKIAVESVADNLLNKNYEIMQDSLSADERDEHLSNLSGYFNEERGTWYEQICANFKHLTGMPANKWSALTWTVHLSMGQSTFEYLVNQRIIHKSYDGKYKLDSELGAIKDLEKFGYDPERIQHLIDTDFEELK
ncbi:hypothetical protein P7E14_13845 [Enterococcus gallinarum]|uniref:hypothetical protein n=1 Tax=Enterococcus gallinarum TaxID=1353 RepID=UPI002891C52D|nr:hypothetical protein [Enterococcus gallinarum]MDT2724916.1 hypothetical protein [Enterococcus gallinarum]